jgi:hypothetical protein
MITHIILTLTLVTGSGQPDVNHRTEFQGTLEDCWKQARPFVDAPRPQIDGVIGLAAQCAVYIVGDDQ